MISEINIQFLPQEMSYLTLKACFQAIELQDMTQTVVLTIYQKPETLPKYLSEREIDALSL